MKRKIKIAFVFPLNLKEGGSTKLFFQFIKYLPKDKFDLTFVDTNYQVNKSLSDLDLSGILKGVGYKTIDSIDKKFKFIELWNTDMSRFAKAMSIVFFYFLETLIAPIYCRYRNDKNTLSGYDFLYFVRNTDVRHFPLDKKTFALGSTHLIGLGFRGLKGDIFAKFYGFLTRRLEGIHYFTESYRQTSKVNKKKDLVLPNGIEGVTVSDGLLEPSGRAKFLSVGRLEPSKGILEMLEAFESVILRDIELHICGTGNLDDVVQKTARIDERITYHGYVSEKELHSLYQICDFFILPTHGETFGLTAIEALSHGLYVLASSDLFNVGTAEVYQQFVRKDMMTLIELSSNNLKKKVEYLSENVSIYREKRKAHIGDIRALTSRYEWKDLIREFNEWVEERVQEKGTSID